jgi:LCP family protein required for cell wall assembly
MSSGGAYGGPAYPPPLPPHLDPRGGRGRSRRNGWRGVARNGSMTVFGLLSVVLLVVAGYAWWTLRDGNKRLQRLPEVNARAASNGTAGTAKPDIDGKDENLLVVGNDDRSTLTNKQVKELHVGRDGGSLATDSIMIIHIPANGKKATLISIPRDAYVAIPGYGKNKINAAYALAYNHAPGTANDKRAAGANLLIETVANLTGLTIDHFVQVTLYGFVLISNAVGGVDVNLCNAVNDTVAHNRAIGSDGGSGLVLSAGRHSIKGVVALEFVRQRHNLPNGDLDRTARQRYFLTQAFKKVASAGTLVNPTRLSDLVDAVDQSIWVDSSLDLTSLARQVGSLDANNIVGKAIPFEGFQTVGVGSVEIVDPAKVQKFVANLINPPKVTPPTTKPSTSGSKPATPSKSSSSGTKTGCIN